MSNRRYRQEDRSDDKAEGDFNRASINEEAVADQIAVAHNALNSPLTLEVYPQGVRRGLIKGHLGKNPGDSKFVFTAKKPEGEHLSFDGIIEIKNVRTRRPIFRPKDDDIKCCLAKSRPYLLVMHFPGKENLATSPSCMLTVLDEKQLKHIAATHELEIDKSGFYYNGKKWFYTVDYNDYDRVSLRDLKHNGSLKVWQKQIKTMRRLCKKQI